MKKWFRQYLKKTLVFGCVCLALGACYHNDVPDFVINPGDSIEGDVYRGTFVLKFTVNEVVIDTATLSVDSTTFVISHLPLLSEKVKMKYLHAATSAYTEYFMIFPDYDTNEQSVGYYDKSKGIWNGRVYSRDNQSYFFTSVEKK